MFAKIVIFIGLLLVGVACLKYTEAIKGFTGDIGFAEKYLGSGGTYSFIKLVGVLLLVLSVVHITGTYDKLVPGFLLRSGGV